MLSLMDFVGGQSKPAPYWPWWAILRYIFIPRRPETCSPKRGHLGNMNKMKGQRRRHCCQHSFTHSGSTSIFKGLFYFPQIGGGG